MTEACAHCGHPTQDYAGGWANGHEGETLCHPNESDRPDCYHLVTNSTYGHTVAPCVKCGLSEPPDGTRIEFEFGSDTYAAWRDDESSRLVGYSIGDGGETWCVYGESVPCTWVQLVERFDADSLRLAIRLVPHPDDAANRDLWPTSVYAREDDR